MNKDPYVEACLDLATAYHLHRYESVICKPPNSEAIQLRAKELEEAYQVFLNELYAPRPNVPIETKPTEYAKQLKKLLAKDSTLTRPELAKKLGITLEKLNLYLEDY